jgi:hypothetical protein
MIERLARIATHLRRFTPLTLLVAAAALTVFVQRVLQLESLEQDAAAMLSLVLLLWSLVALALAGLLSDYPPPAAANEGWLRRAGRWLKRLAYRVLGAMVVALALGSLLLSYQLLRVLLG